jgi:uncharacterized protein YndB with AHSA1/START domain
MDDPELPDRPDTRADDRSVTRQIDVEVDPDELWRTIVDDEERAAWWGGDTELDLRPGGDGHATDPDGTIRRIRVDEVEPGRRLAYRWWTDDDASAVELVVLPRPDGSRLTVTETRAAHGALAPTLERGLLELELLVLCRVAV